MLPRLDDLYCTDPSHPLSTAGEELDHLDRDISVDDPSVHDLSVGGVQVWMTDLRLVRR